MDDLAAVGIVEPSGAYTRSLFHMVALCPYYKPSGLLDIPHHLVPRELHFAYLLKDIENIE